MRKKMRTINIKGDILDNDWGRIYEYYGWDYMSPKKMENELKSANGDEVVFMINSGGGSVFDGYDIFNAIKEYRGKTTAKIVGLAASAASFIAMGADKVQACALSQMMIHRAANANQGNAPSHHANGNFLEGVDNTIVKAYTMRNGKTDEEMIKLMDETTWLTPTQALENGIVDEIVNDTVEKPLIINAYEENKQVLMSKLFKIDSMDELKMLLNKQIMLGQEVTNSATLDIKNIQMEGEKMEKPSNKEELVAQYPDLCKQIANDAATEATNQERVRVKDVLSLQKAGINNLVKQGLEDGLTKGEVACNILAAQEKLTTETAEAIQEDIQNSNVNNVPSANTPVNQEAEEEKTALDSIKNFMNKMGGRK